jgi:pimeloyl-ACP methyl ester carboxylesterase
MLASTGRGNDLADEARGDWHLRESGDPGSPVVVFLHGAGLSGRMWADHMATLTNFHCLAPDFPGCGMSNQIPWTSRNDAADHVAGLIKRRVPTGRAHVVGISLGGAVAHSLLARHSDLVDRVVIDGSGVLPSWNNRLFLIGIAAIAPFLHTRAVIAALSRSVGQIPEADRAEIRVASRRDFWRSYADALGTRATRAEVDAACTTLLVAGEKETVVRQSNAALAALMAHTTARFVPGLGHGWLGSRMDLHLAMVEAWLTRETVPNGLQPERPWPDAVRRLRRELEARE